MPDRIPTADERLERAKSAFALLMLVTNALSKSDDGTVDLTTEVNAWAWSRIEDVCRDGYDNVTLAAAALSRETSLQVLAPVGKDEDE
jgi:hypothetical protein